MELRIFLVAAIALLAVPLPAALAGGTPDEGPPLLVLDNLGKYSCPTMKSCPVLYVDHDGKLWRETNDKVNLQRGDRLEGGTLRHADEGGGLLP